INDPAWTVLAEYPPFRAVLTWHDWLAPTFLFRLVFWLGFATAIGLLSWPLRDTSSGAFAIGMTGSAVVFVGTFFLVGVAGDFRYGYWCVLAYIASAAALAAAAFQKLIERSARTSPIMRQA